MTKYNVTDKFHHIVQRICHLEDTKQLNITALTKKMETSLISVTCCRLMCSSISTKSQCWKTNGMLSWCSVSISHSRSLCILCSSFAMVASVSSSLCNLPSTKTASVQSNLANDCLAALCLPFQSYSKHVLSPFIVANALFTNPALWILVNSKIFLIVAAQY